MNHKYISWVIVLRRCFDSVRLKLNIELSISVTLETFFFFLQAFQPRVANINTKRKHLLSYFANETNICGQAIFVRIICWCKRAAYAPHPPSTGAMLSKRSWIVITLLVRFNTAIGGGREQKQELLNKGSRKRERWSSVSLKLQLTVHNICFLIFGFHDQTLALVFYILHKKTTAMT